MYTTLLIFVSLYILPYLSESAISKLGVLDEDITLACDLTRSNPPRITWSDFVFNPAEDPAQIYSTAHDPSSRQIDPSHPNKENFVVEEDYSLRIKNLGMNGSGAYTCTSEVNGEILERTYYVNVHVKPFLKCTGETSLMEGGSTRLSCRGNYTGNQPTVTWYRGEGQGQELQGIDKFDIQVAGRDLELKSVTYKDDQEKFVCRMQFGTTVKQCSLTLSVKHVVRDIKFSPMLGEGESLPAGEELKCLASGNPAPKIEMSPSSDMDKSGVGMRAIKIRNEWIGQQIKVTCTATNTLNGVTEKLAKDITFNVKEVKSQAISSGNTLGIVVGLVIACLLLVAIVVAVLLIRRRKSQSPPKGSKPLPTKEQITNGQNTQNDSQRPQRV